MSWKDDVDSYINYLESQGKSAKMVKTYIMALAKHVEKRRKASLKSLLDLRREEVVDYMGSLAKRGLTGKGGLSPSSLSSIFGKLRSTVRYVAKLGHGQPSPPFLMGLAFGKKESRIKADGELPSEEEVELIGKKLDQPYKAIWLAACACGSRPSELLGVPEKYVHENSNGWAFSFAYTKTDRPRTTHVVKPPAIQALKDWEDLREEGDTLFFGDVSIGAYGKALGRAGERLVSRGKLGAAVKLTPYTSRHFRVSELQRLGAKPNLIEAETGMSIVMQKNYTHLNASVREKQILDLEKIPKMVPESDYEQLQADLSTAERKIIRLERMVADTLGILGSAENLEDVQAKLFMAKLLPVEEDKATKERDHD